MEIFVVVFVILIGAVGAVAYSAFSSKDATKIKKIMADLGLGQGTWAAEDGAQFYKWGWHQEQENRVSAERMVKQAFQRAGVWLDRQDLAFFESQCKRHEANNEINPSQIEERVHGIINRSERVRRWAAAEVQTVVQYAQSLNPQEAANALKESGAEVEPEAAHETLVAIEMQRMLYRHGGALLAINAKGLSVKDPVSAQVFELTGMDSWRHLIRMFKDEIQEQIAGRRTPVPVSISRGLRVGVESGFFHHIEVDIERQRSFLKRVHDQFHNKEINTSLERAKTVDAILYKWKFDDGTHFNQDDHNRVRELLSRLDLAPRFREVIFERFEESYSSLFSLIRMFPREVIFYGGSGSARCFATDQYSRHFLSLLEALARPSGRDKAPPSIVLVSEEQIEKMRQGPKRGSKAVTVTQLVGDQQRISRLERGVTEDIANRVGWIVNLSADDLTEIEFAALNKEPLKKYVRFHCEAGEDVDFINNTYNAKKSRIQFFNMVVDSLVEIPNMQDETSAEPIAEAPSPKQDAPSDDGFDDGLESVSEPASDSSSQTV